jgi:ABC-2 type transport system permease protein
VFGEMMNLKYLAYSVGFSVVAIIIGVIAFKKNEDKFILEI